MSVPHQIDNPSKVESQLKCNSRRDNLEVLMCMKKKQREQTSTSKKIWRPGLT